MYDRYTIGSSSELLEKVFQVKIPDSYTPSYNAVPTQLLPILTPEKKCRLCFWGLPANLSNNKAISSKLYNLPASSAFQRPVYQKQIEKNRCIILADGFYTWKQVGKKQKTPYFCYFQDRAPFGIAGVWEEYEDFEGNVSENFNMITVSATHEARNYQEDMPAILKGDLVAEWLNKDLSVEKAEELLKAVSAADLGSHAVSPVITNSRIDDERLIKPATPSDQFGNYTLFS